MTAGIVAEYNPFHNGHKYHLQKTREGGADRIVVIMSANAVQRGDIAIYDKQLRAQQAVENGADLVIELPCPYSCANAQIFAESAVRLMAGLGEGVVERISFGCECSDIEKLTHAARELEKLDDSPLVAERTAAGLSYPRAVYEAACELGFGEVLGSPNNTLAVEYIKAVRKLAPWITPMAVERQGAEHDSQVTKGRFASASQLRRMIAEGMDISPYVPQVSQAAPSFLKNGEKIMLYKLLTADEQALAQLPDMTDNLKNRLLGILREQRHELTSIEKLYQLVKSKNFTLARIRRTLLHLTLGVKQDGFTDIPYGRILALNERGREILSQAKDKKTLEYSASLAKLSCLTPQAKTVAELELAAGTLMQLCSEGSFSPMNDYTRSVRICR